MSSPNKIIFFSACLLFFVIGFLVTIGGIVLRTKLTNSNLPSAVDTATLPASSATPGFTPQPRVSSSEPPAQASVGTVTEITGEAEKQPRDQDEAVDVTTGLHIKESERITTKEDATALLTFPESFTIKLEPETVVAFLSTDPAHFLIRQDQGTAIYTTDQTVNLISIRFKKGLFRLGDGIAEVTTDPSEGTMSMTIKEGSGKFGHINSDNQTVITAIPQGSTLVYEDSSKSVQLD